MSSLQQRIDNIATSISSRTGLSAMVPGSKIYQLVESLAQQNIDLEIQISDFANKNSIATATGIDLDKIGENLFGVPRIQATAPFATASMKVIKFYVKIGSFGDINRDNSRDNFNQAKNIILAEGTTIEGSYGGLYFKMRTTSEYVLDVNASEVYVSAQLVQGDYATIPSNVLTYHNFTNYTQSKGNLLLVTNPVAISTGSGQETDNAYRYRISKAIKAIPKTTYYGIYDAAITVPGVADVNIVTSPTGGGTVTVYIQGTTPITSDEVIQDVSVKLENCIPPWATYSVEKPFCVGVALYLTVNVTNISEYVRSVIIDKVSEYINNFYGNTFYVNRILSVVSAAHESVNSAVMDSITTYVGTSDFRESADVIDYSDPNNPMIYLRPIDKLVIEPIPNAIIINLVA